jgi:DNA-binding XRE family transcriptional regulator
MTKPTSGERFISRDGQFQIGGLTPEQSELIAERRRRGGRRSASTRPARLQRPPLSELRNARGLTQAELGERMGIGQKGVSKLERQPDLLLSTLAAYVESLGGHVELVIGKERIPLGLQTSSDDER